MLELAKGKAPVEVANAKELVSILGTLRKAVEQGELDAKIEAVGAAVKARLTRSSALEGADKSALIAAIAGRRMVGGP